MRIDRMSSVVKICSHLWFVALFFQHSCLFPLDKFEQCFLNVCQKFRRDFAVLDLLENKGELKKLVPDSFDFCYIVAQKGISPGDFLAHERLIILDKQFDFNMMRMIGQCEDFDIVLLELKTMDFCLQKIKILMDLSLVVLFKINNLNYDKLKEFALLIKRKGIALVTEINSSCLMLTRCQQKCITRGWINGRKKYYPVRSTFTEKFLVKQKNLTSWTSGMNLWNFLCLEGLYPLRLDILDSVKQLFRDTYHDFYPWNILIQGKKLVAIDQVPPRFNHRIDQLRVTLFILQHNVLSYPLQKNLLTRFLKIT